MRFRLALAVLLLVLPRAASAERVKVAIVPGTAVNLEITRVDALSQDLADALRTELDVDTIAGLEVRRRLPDAGLPADCVVNPGCIADVARRLEAQQLLFVVMIDTGTSGAIQVDTTWVDSVNHKSAARPAIQVPSTGDARTRFAAAATQLLPDAEVRDKPQGGLGRLSAPVGRHFQLASYLTAGGTAVGIGVGIALGVRTRSKYNACEQLAPSSECSSGERDSIRRSALFADLGWAVAVGGMIATGVLYATSSESPHLIVEPSPSGVAVSAVGRF
ncbi:MAG: hypothetical protein ABIY55_15875 [Kofleriaceae bacterium]